jgi:hypothetical protein
MIMSLNKITLFSPQCEQYFFFFRLQRMWRTVSDYCVILIFSLLSVIGIYIYIYIVGAVVAVIEWSLDLQLPMQSVPIATYVVSSNLDQGKVYNIM